jgi:hypothetical protein
MSTLTRSHVTPVEELVVLLESYAPEELVELQKLYPNEQGRLRSTKLLGNGDIPLPLAVDTCLRGMRTALDLCRKQMKPLSTKLIRARRLQNIGKIFAAIGSASLFGLLATKYEAAKYAASAVAFVGTLLPEIAGALTATIHPEEKNLFDYHRRLADLESEAMTIWDELTLCKRAGYVEKGSSGETRDLIRRGNSVSYNLLSLLRKQPV